MTNRVRMIPAAALAVAALAVPAGARADEPPASVTVGAYTFTIPTPDQLAADTYGKGTFEEDTYGKGTVSADTYGKG
jgi:hypothetical protein